MAIIKNNAILEKIRNETIVILQLSSGQHSATGPRESNEDFCGAVLPENQQFLEKGAVFALADGVSGGAAGREAAEYSVRGLLADYYATPDTWTVTQSLDKVLIPLNRWLNTQASSRHDLMGMSSTLSTLVMRGCRYFCAHVGDSRIYRLRAGALSQLTTDHVWDRPDMRHVLKRAMGLDQHLVLDFSEGELQQDDVFLLVSDGVWEPLGDLNLFTVLRNYHNPQLAAEELVRLAHRQGGQDNASAMVIRVDAIPDKNLRDTLSAQRYLPVPARLKSGTRLDDFEILQLLHESRMSLLYKVKHIVDGRLWVLKTLPPMSDVDSHMAEALLQEEWLAKKVTAHYFPQIYRFNSEQRSALYYVMSWHEGATLQQHLDVGRHFSITDTVQVAIRLVKGIAALHRLNILHRDIKPANIHLDTEGKLRILDFGVAASDGLHPLADGAGTPSYMAPELLAGAPAHAQTDLYAIGVTLYYLLARKYPYGEVEPFQHPKFGEPSPVIRYRPDVPQWLETILLKAVARDPLQRFETAEELLLALEHGERRPLDPLRRAPLLEKNPTLLWKSIALFSILLNLMLLYVLLVGSVK